MAQDGGSAAGEDRSVPAPVELDQRVTDCVHAGVERVEASGGQPALDRSAPYPQLQELPSCNHPPWRAARRAIRRSGDASDDRAKNQLRPACARPAGGRTYYPPPLAIRAIPPRNSALAKRVAPATSAGRRSSISIPSSTPTPAIARAM